MCIRDSPCCVSVKIELIHPEGDQEIFGLPLFLIGILVLHAKPLHHFAASGVVDVMGGGDVWDVILFQLCNNGIACLCDDTFVQELFGQRVTEIMCVVRGDVDITDWDILFPKADGLEIGLSLIHI